MNDDKLPPWVLVQHDTPFNGEDPDPDPEAAAAALAKLERGYRLNPIEVLSPMPDFSVQRRDEPPCGQ